MRLLIVTLVVLCAQVSAAEPIQGAFGLTLGQALTEGLGDITNDRWRGTEFRAIEPPAPGDFDRYTVAVTEGDSLVAGIGAMKRHADAAAVEAHVAALIAEHVPAHGELGELQRGPYTAKTVTHDGRRIEIMSDSNDGGGWVALNIMDLALYEQVKHEEPRGN